MSHSLASLSNIRGALPMFLATMIPREGWSFLVTTRGLRGDCHCRPPLGGWGGGGAWEEIASGMWWSLRVEHQPALSTEAQRPNELRGWAAGIWIQVNMPWRHGCLPCLVEKTSHLEVSSFSHISKDIDLKQKSYTSELETNSLYTGFRIRLVFKFKLCHLWAWYGK